jgi:hypothetical protein
MKCFQVNKHQVKSGIEVSRPLLKRTGVHLKVGEKKVPLRDALALSPAAFEGGRLIEADYVGRADSLELVAVNAAPDAEHSNSVLVRFSIDLQLHGQDTIKVDCARGQAELLAYHRKQHVVAHVGFGAGAGITLLFHTSEGLLCMEPGSEVEILDKARFDQPTGLLGWLKGEEPDYYYQTNRTVIRFDGDRVTVDSRPDMVHNY